MLVRRSFSLSATPRYRNLCTDRIRATAEAVRGIEPLDLGVSPKHVSRNCSRQLRAAVEKTIHIDDWSTESALREKCVDIHLKIAASIERSHDRLRIRQVLRQTEVGCLEVDTVLEDRVTRTTDILRSTIRDRRKILTAIESVRDITDQEHSPAIDLE